MTLIISCATQEYAIQVSDRRLMWTNGQFADDQQNKGVLFDFRVAFAYTGLAQIGNQRTDVWLTRTLADPRCTSLSNALDVLKDEASARFGQLCVPYKWKNHTFVGVGWTRQPPDPVLRPIICRTSNHITAPDWRPPSDPGFQNRVLVLKPNEPLRWITDGQELTPDSARRLGYMLRREIRRGDPPDLVLLTLVKAIRKCADSNPAVGKSLLSVVVPKKAVEHGGEDRIASTGSPLPDRITFQCWPEGRWDGIIWGPNFAFGNLSYTNFRAGSLDPDGGLLLGGMTVSDSGGKTIHFPCCAVRKKGLQTVLSLSSSDGKCVGIFTELTLLNRVLEKEEDAEPVLFYEPAALRCFLEQVRNYFGGVYFNPGGSDERCGSLNLVRVTEMLDNR